MPQKQREPKAASCTIAFDLIHRTTNFVCTSTTNHPKLNEASFQDRSWSGAVHSFNRHVKLRGSDTPTDATISFCPALLRHDPLPFVPLAYSRHSSERTIDTRSVTKLSIFPSSLLLLLLLFPGALRCPPRHPDLRRRTLRCSGWSRLQRRGRASGEQRHFLL